MEYSNEAWDCDPNFQPDPSDASYDDNLDFEDSNGDWQSIALDRFGDRLIRGDY